MLQYLTSFIPKHHYITTLHSIHFQSDYNYHVYYYSYLTFHTQNITFGFRCIETHNLSTNCSKGQLVKTSKVLRSLTKTLKPMHIINSFCMLNWHYYQICTVWIFLLPTIYVRSLLVSCHRVWEVKNNVNLELTSLVGKCAGCQVTSLLCNVFIVQH